MSDDNVLYVTLAILGAAFSLGSATHALLNKRDPRAQLGWLVTCVLMPVAGSVIYWLLGVNRIRTRARKWQDQGEFGYDAGISGRFDARSVSITDEYPVLVENMLQLLQISRTVTQRPLLPGNSVTPLFNGEQAYPEMLKAIRQAKRYVYMCTYLFETGATGREFIETLAEAGARGLDVRVLLDGVGERYAWPRAGTLLRKKQNVKVARFLPIGLNLRGLRINLRNHRKLLLCDGVVGFTGGMNIGRRHMLEAAGNKNRTADIQKPVKSGKHFF